MSYPYAAFLLNKLPIYAEYAHICDVLPEWMKKDFLECNYERKVDWATAMGIEIDGSSYDTKKKDMEQKNNMVAVK